VSFSQRDLRRVGPLTVETEVKGAYEYIIHMKRVLPWLVLRARRAGKIDSCLALAA
jgi:hypothetical protein